MKKAVEHNIKMVMVLNKMDKLFEFFDLSLEEIYYHLNGIIETANASINLFLE